MRLTVKARVFIQVFVELCSFFQCNFHVLILQIKGIFGITSVTRKLWMNFVFLAAKGKKSCEMYQVNSGGSGIV